jgi:hypothetical protein
VRLPLLAQGLLPKGQTTIISTHTGALTITRPPLAPRPGPKPATGPWSTTILGRRIIGGENEQAVVRSFAEFRLSRVDNGEPGDQELADSQGLKDEDLQEEDEYEYIPRR